MVIYPILSYFRILFDFTRYVAPAYADSFTSQGLSILVYLSTNLLTTIALFKLAPEISICTTKVLQTPAVVTLNELET